MILTWTVADIPPVYSREKVTAMIGRACDAWSKALAGKVRFQFLSPDEVEDDEADLVFKWGRLDNPLLLAQHEKIGDVDLITFRDVKHNGTPQVWEFTLWDHIKIGAVHFLSVVLHELGHSLGCKDHVAPGAGCMEPNRNKRWTKPTAADVALILKTLRAQ